MTNGGIIGPANTPSLSTATGIWKIEEVYAAKKTNTFPVLSPFPARYFILQPTSLVGGGGDSLMQMSEFNLMNGASRITSATYYSWNLSFTAAGAADASTYPSGENPTMANDASTSTKWLDFRGSGGGLYIDLGALATTTGYQWYTANDGTWRDMSGWKVWCSKDNVTWSLVSTVTGFTPTSSRQALAGSWTW